MSVEMPGGDFTRGHVAILNTAARSTPSPTHAYSTCRGLPARAPCRAASLSAQLRPSSAQCLPPRGPPEGARIQEDRAARAPRPTTSRWWTVSPQRKTTPPQLRLLALLWQLAYRSCRLQCALDAAQLTDCCSIGLPSRGKELAVTVTIEVVRRCDERAIS